jgi:hypothetical protein
MKILCVVELMNMVIESDFKTVSETYRLQKYTKEFTKEKGNKHSKAKNFIPTLLYTWHMTSTWYILDWQISICPTMAPRLVSQCRQDHCVVCIQG